MINKSSKQNQPKKKMTKTTMSLPEDLWKATKIRAIEEGVNAQDIVARVLEQYFKKGSKA